MGGHSWQKRSLNKLGKDYCGTYGKSSGTNSCRGSRKYSLQYFHTFFECKFQIQNGCYNTWNRESAVRYVEEKRFPPENDFTGKGPTHPGDNMELLRLLDHYTFSGIDPQVGDIQYYLYDPVAHGADPGKSIP